MLVPSMKATKINNDMKKEYFQIYHDLFQLIYIEKDIYDLAQKY